jgi:hypothetical protein
LTPDQCTEIFNSTYDAGISELKAQEPDLTVWMTGGRRKTETDIDHRREEGAAQVLSYIDYLKSSGEVIWTAPDGRLAVELEIQFTLSGVAVIVYIDQVVLTPNGILVVRDLKTGSSYNSPLQLATYDLAIEAQYGFRIGWGDFWQAKKGQPSKPINLNAYTAERVGAWYVSMDAAEQNGTYLPNPSDKCANMCGVSQWCTAVGGIEYTTTMEVPA